MKVIIPYTPRPIQRKIHGELDKYRWACVVAHRRFGKTVMVINQLVKRAVKNKLRNPRYGYVAPLYSQAKQIAWDYLKFYTRPIPGVKINESELWVELPNGARIKLFGSDNPDSLRGLYFDGVVLDEYADMKSVVWSEVIRPALADRGGFAIFIGTPRGLNQFYEIYQLALHSESWYSGIFPVDATNVLSEEELEAAKETGMTDAAFRQEFYCDFTASSEDIFIPLSIVEPALGKHLIESAYNGAPRILGVDVARFGDDATEFYLRQGLAAWHLGTVTKQDTMVVAARTAQLIREHNTDANFVDETGLGAGVVDRLRQLSFDVIGVNAGSSADKGAVYRNKRAEMWGNMKQWLIDGGALPNDKMLAAQLSTPMYSFDPANRIVLEKKVDIKKRGLKSPDRAEGLAQTFAYPVFKKPDFELHVPIVENKATTEYNLFA